MKIRISVCLIVIVSGLFCSGANASYVQSIEVPAVDGLTDGDFAKIIFETEAQGKTVQNILVERTRVQILPGAIKGKILLRLPCLSAAEIQKVSLALKVGKMYSELVEKGPPRNGRKMDLIEMIPDSRGITDGWCMTPLRGATQP